MNPRDELDVVRRQIGGIEYELGQLKERLRRIEEELAPAMPTPAASVSLPTPEPLRLSTVVESAVPTPGSPLPQFPPHLGAATTQPPPILPSAVRIAPPEPRESPTPTRNLLREWLEPLQLWPPSGEQDAEVRLGAWWATRIGAALAVTGVVFLGVYVSRGASPWVRLAEVLAVTAVVIAAGARLERRVPRFGQVLIGAGLALAYFTAFAAYGVAPMKVTDRGGIAIAAQLAVVALVLAVAWRRDSSVVASMAVALGHLTAFISLRVGPPGFGPWVVLLLGIAAVALRRARGWGGPSLIALPTAWLYVATSAVTQQASAWHGWTWTMLYFAVFTLRDWTISRRAEQLGPLDRGAQIANSTLAVGVGLLVTLEHAPTQFAGFYLGAALVMAGVTWLWRAAGAEALVPVFFCKASGLAGLAIIAAFEGHVRYLALLAQAFAMLVTARQSSVRGLRTATAVVALVALVMFLDAAMSARVAGQTGRLVAEGVFLLGLVALFAGMQRWLAIKPALAAGAATLAGIAGVIAVSTWNTAPWTPLVFLGMGLLVLGIPVLLRAALTGGVAAGLYFIAAHIALWRMRGHDQPVGRIWVNELGLLSAAALSLRFGFARLADPAARQAGEVVMVGLSGATLVVVLFETCRPDLAFAAAACAGLLFVGWASWRAKSALLLLSAPILAFAAVLHGDAVERGAGPWLWLAAGALWGAAALGSANRREATEREDRARLALWLLSALATWATVRAVELNVAPAYQFRAYSGLAMLVFGLAWRPGLRPALEGSWMLWLLAIAAGFHAPAWPWAGALGLVPAVALARVGALSPQKIPPPRWRAHADTVQMSFALLVGLMGALQFKGAVQLAALGVFGALVWATWRWGRVAAGQWAVVAVAATAWSQAVKLAWQARDAGWSTTLLAVEGVAVATIAVPFWVARNDTGTSRRLHWTAGGLGLALAMGALMLQRGAVAPYATIGCGVASVGCFVAGLVLRSRPHRLVGLVGLALCIVRAFVVDLDSTLHRIAAFVALGVVLLWVGFSYHRFRHWIVAEQKKH